METTRLNIPYGRFKTVWAQVTMLDAGHGDCYMVDINLGNDPSFAPQKRIIIDTGPEAGYRQRGLIRMIKEVGLPNIKHPQSISIPPVDYVQITHIDDDHAGNAIGLVRAVPKDGRLRELFRETGFIFHELPHGHPQFNVQIRNYAGKRKKALKSEVTVEIECVPFDDETVRWLGDAKTAGIVPEYWFNAEYFANIGDVPEELCVCDKNGKRVMGGTVVDAMTQNDLYLAQHGYKLATGSWNDLNQHQFAPSFKVNLSPVYHGTDFVVINFLIRFPQVKKVGVFNQQSFITAGTYPPGLTASTKVKWAKKRSKSEHPLLIKATRCMQMGKNTPFDPPMLDCNNLAPSVQKNVYPWDDPNSKDEASQIATFVRLKGELKKMRVGGNLNQFCEDNFKPLQDHLILTGENAPLWDISIRGPTLSTWAELWAHALEIALGNSLGYVPAMLEWGATNKGIANRASIITHFRRYSRFRENRNDPPVFTMLFTGDAYDTHSDIRDTFYSWFENTKYYVDVLKVPHHGSATTTSKSFYEVVRAYVYLISAKQTFHGNPQLITLETIVRGMERHPNDGPGPTHYLFFSDPNSFKPQKDEKTGTLYKTNAALLLTGSYRPNIKTGLGNIGQGPPRSIYNYECYCLRGGGQSNEEPRWGRILFGESSNPDCEGGREIYFDDISEWRLMTYELVEKSWENAVVSDGS